MAVFCFLSILARNYMWLTAQPVGCEAGQTNIDTDRLGAVHLFYVSNQAEPPGAKAVSTTK